MDEKNRLPVNVQEIHRKFVDAMENPMDKEIWRSCQQTIAIAKKYGKTPREVYRRFEELFGIFHHWDGEPIK